jgi:hypothetical protein
MSAADQVPISHRNALKHEKKNEETFLQPDWKESFVLKNKCFEFSWQIQVIPHTALRVMTVRTTFFEG